MKIGFIGLGIMGSRMAANLQKNGHTLVLYNRTKARADELLANGASWADTPAQVGEQAELVITMLAHPQAVEAVAFGEAGLLATLNSGALWINCSTVNPSFSKEMAQATTAKQIRYLEAPVAGSKNQAAQAELVFIVGGAAEDVAEAQPLFEAMGSRVAHVGGHGQGTGLKVVVNTLLGTSMAAFAEALVLGEALGLSQEMLLNVLIGGPVVPPYMTSKKEKLVQGDFDPEFPLQWMQKDMHLAAVTAQEVGVTLPVGNVTKDMYRLAIRQGLGEADFSAIYQMFGEKGEE